MKVYVRWDGDLHLCCCPEYLRPDSAAVIVMWLQKELVPYRLSLTHFMASESCLYSQNAESARRKSSQTCGIARAIHYATCSVVERNRLWVMLLTYFNEVHEGHAIAVIVGCWLLNAQPVVQSWVTMCESPCGCGGTVACFHLSFFCFALLIALRPFFMPSCHPDQAVHCHICSRL